MRAKLTYKKKRKRIGRGNGSGHGKTSTRGQKGQRSRSGWNLKPGFEGGQNPLYRRLPKRGFSNVEFRTSYTVINLDRLNTVNESEVTPEVLLSNGLIKKTKLGIKILGTGQLTKALTVKANRFSKSAKEAIEKAGGKAIEI